MKYTHEDCYRAIANAVWLEAVRRDVELWARNVLLVRGALPHELACLPEWKRSFGG